MKAEPVTSDILVGLPGAEIIEAGLLDLARSKFDSVEALLVLMGAPRMERCGFAQFREIPPEESVDLELKLYRRLSEEFPTDAYPRYGALKSRLGSFLSALESRWKREQDL